MPSSISNSDRSMEQLSVHERAVASLGSAGLIAVILFIALMAGWEAWVRSEGMTPAYRNSGGLWAEQRRRIDNGEGDAWVIVGSSRVLFDIQLKVWERLDGRAPIQLALEGSSPMSVLEGLAEDPDFTGNVIVGVAPGLFFSGFAYRQDAMDRYVEETPTQWFGQQVSLLIEPWLAFYDSEWALPTILDRLPWPQREGAEWSPDVRKLSLMERDRNTRMWDKLEYDEEYRELARSIWADGWTPLAERGEEAIQRNAENRAKQIERAVAAVEKLRAKGSGVILARMPAEGHYAISEPDSQPRDQAWDVLIERAGAPGYHFADHEEMQGYWLPEWSHMTGEEADRFTEAFYGLLKSEHPEMFARTKPSSAAASE